MNSRINVAEELIHTHKGKHRLKHWVIAHGPWPNEYASIVHLWHRILVPSDCLLSRAWAEVSSGAWPSSAPASTFSDFQLKYMYATQRAAVALPNPYC